MNLFPANTYGRMPSIFDELTDRQEWQAQSACSRKTDYIGRTIDPDWWFKQAYPETPAVWRAKTICRSECPVRLECLAYITENEQAGTWGGFTERERREMAAAERKNAHAETK